MKRKACLIILILVWGICLVLLARQIKPHVTVDRNMYLLDSVAVPIRYEVVSENSMNCNIATMSTIVYRMLKDGYEIIESKITEDRIDIIMNNADCAIRIVYEKSGAFTSLASPYEKSFVPMTYINEEVSSE